MADRLMIVTHAVERTIGREFVSADPRAALHMGSDMRGQVFHADVIDVAGDDFAITLDHAEDNGLVGVSAAFGLLRPLAADVGLVDFDMPTEPAIPVNLTHVLADFVTDAPRGFVGDAKLALQFLGGDAMTGSREQVHGIEPLLQRRMRALERGALHGVQVMAAVAGPRGELGEPVEAANDTAFRANRVRAEPDGEQMLQTGIVGREPLEKVFYCEGFSHCRPLDTYNMGTA